ncbi:hypothetical protein [Mycobacterium sp.]|uniref:hypothetical protein n=1 Tax=Mycobacterium sp. TaxID=1785 RepID=UPI003D0F6169
MAFADDFAAQLTQRGIQTAASALPSDSGTVGTELQKANDWFFSLDAAVREGFDEGSAQEPVCSVLASPELNVTPDLGGLFEAFDATSGKTFSERLSIAQEAFSAAQGQV